MQLVTEWDVVSGDPTDCNTPKFCVHLGWYFLACLAGWSPDHQQSLRRCKVDYLLHHPFPQKELWRRNEKKTDWAHIVMPMLCTMQKKIYNDIDYTRKLSDTKSTQRPMVNEGHLMQITWNLSWVSTLQKLFWHYP